MNLVILPLMVAAAHAAAPLAKVAEEEGQRDGKRESYDTIIHFMLQ